MTDVLAGYKLTEVGVIPQDWKVTALGECLLDDPEYGINAPAVDYSDLLPTYIRITDISEEGRFKPESITSVAHPDSGHYFLEDGDLVFARTGASVGKSYLYRPEDGRMVFAGFLIRVKLNQAKLLPRYLANWTQSGQYRHWVALMSMRSGQPGINGKEYAQLPIPLPPTLAEQRAIADALSEVDDRIATFDDAIAKKRVLMQGAMQRLLTGQERLPGFSKAWEVRRLGEIAEIDPENLGSDTNPNYRFNYISLEDVDYGVLRSFTEQTFRTSPSRARRVVRKNDILFATVRPNLKSHLLVRENVSDTICSTGFAVVRCHSTQAQSIFVFLHMFADTIGKQIESFLVGSSYPAINSQDVRMLAIPIPNDEAEQTAVATILSDIAIPSPIMQHFGTYRAGE